MDERKNTWTTFCKIIKKNEGELNGRKIILYGAPEAASFVKWYIETILHIRIKAVIARWETSAYQSIFHLMSLYHLKEDNDLIVNCNLQEKEPKHDFCDIGEDWDATGYSEGDILDLREAFYTKDTSDYTRDISYYDWLEHAYNLDIIDSIRRANVTNGKNGAHGYYPTDSRMIYDVYHAGYVTEQSRLFDFGCGKGASLITWYELGVNAVGGGELTQEIFEVLCCNLKKLSIPYIVESSESVMERDMENGAQCILGDVSLLTNVLDSYDIFFFFNPFSLSVTKKVLYNIFDSMKRVDRQVRIVYAEPIGHRIIMESGMFRLVYKAGDCYNYGMTYDMYVYENL